MTTHYQKAKLISTIMRQNHDFLVEGVRKGFLPLSLVIIASVLHKV